MSLDGHVPHFPSSAYKHFPPLEYDFLLFWHILNPYKSYFFYPMSFLCFPPEALMQQDLETEGKKLSLAEDAENPGRLE